MFVTNCNIQDRGRCRTVQNGSLGMRMITANILEQKMKLQQRMNLYPDPLSLGFMRLQIHSFSGFIEEIWA